MLKENQKYLCNSAVWIEQGASDPVFGDASETRHSLLNIRLDEKTNAITYSTQGEAKSAKVVLFFFIGSSSMDGDYTPPTWKRGDRVESEGNEYVIKGVRQCYDGRRLHHLEVTLE